jgi:alpha-L-arabinofuranosidase
LLVDNQSLFTYVYKPLVKHYAIAGLDNRKNEIVIKVVNAEATPYKTTIDLSHAGKISKSGKVITLAATNETEENTFDEPLKISPKVEAYNAFGTSFDMEFKPWSLTVLRIKKGK